MKNVQLFRITRFLKMFARSESGPVRRQTGEKIQDTGSEGVHETQLVRAAKFSSEVPLSRADIRVECLQLLRKENAMTVVEAAAYLGYPFENVEFAFVELRAARLIELGGTRKVDDCIKALFRLNTTHPALENLLERGPINLRFPEGYWNHQHPPCASRGL